MNSKSCHLTKLINHIPQGVENRLSRKSSTKETFEKKKIIYFAALKEERDNADLSFKVYPKDMRARNVKTDAEKNNFGLLEKHFPKLSEISKFFNKKPLH